MRGSITKKGNKYYGIYDIGRDSNGKRVQKWTKGFDLKGDAEKALAREINKVNLGTYVNPSKSTVAEYLNEWYKEYVEPHLAYNTARGYKVNLNKHIIPKIGQIKLIGLQPIQIQSLYNDKLKEGLSPATVLYIHRTLHKALNQAYKMQNIPRNPSEFVNLPKKKKYHAQFLDKKEVKQLLNIFKDTELYLPVLLGVGVGLRRGEALGLRWQDVDLEKEIIHIKHSLTQKTGGAIMQPTKTDSSRRRIMISEIIVQALNEEISKQKINQQLLGEAYQYNNYVCCNADGSFISPSGFSKSFNNILKKNDFKQIRFHDLRHTNGTLMIMNGTPMKVASDRLGHSSIKVTMDIYTHIIDEAQKEAANTLDLILNE